jgi:nucleoside 2-deoxyribosyltransferase
MTTFYLAAPYAARDQVRFTLNFLQLEDECTARWITARHPIGPGTVDTAPDMSDEYAYQHSEDDLADIDRADAFILLSHSYCSEWGFTLAQTSSGGRHVETGFALAKGKPVYVVGEAENIFHRGLCTVVPDIATAIKEINHANHA